MSKQVVLIGMSHKTAPVETRESVAVPEQDLGPTLMALVGENPLTEAVVINTCNRVEYVAATDDEGQAVEALLAYLERRSGLNRAQLTQHGYVRTGKDALSHLFRVASSLDSLVVGEPQILGQVKNAYAACSEHGATGALLNRTFHHAFQVAKRVRTETKVAENAVSISYAAVELARKVFGRKLVGKRVLVIGAGKMGGLAVRHLRQAGADEIHIANRSVENARNMARALGGTPHALDELERLLTEVDIVITSTGSQTFIIKYDLLKQVMSRRRYRPLFLIDIAVPRDIDPRCDGLNSVYLFDVDDLEKVVEENLRARRKEAARAEDIVVEETNAMLGWIAQHEVVPTIVQLREKLTALKDAELEKLARRDDLSPEAMKAVEKMANALINKILHEPTTSLRESSTNGGHGVLVAAVRNLFNLSDGDKPAPRGES